MIACGHNPVINNKKNGYNSAIITREIAWNTFIYWYLLLWPITTK